jgi:DNA-binding response OmpR family regulator
MGVPIRARARYIAAVKNRVLVAERSPTLQRLITVTLGEEEVTSACFGDGASALADLRAVLPALLIADASLPGVDGYELAAALRASDGGEEVPILLVLNDHEAPDLERMTALGIHDVLSKPFEQHDLRERVRGLLGLQSPAPTAPVDEGGPYKRPIPASRRQPASPSAPEAPLTLEGDELEAAVTRAVEARIHDVVQRALVEALGAIAQAPLEAAIDRAIADALPGVLAESTFDLGQEARAALQAAARAAVEARFEDGGKEILGPLVEPIVWKVVPELAEQHIENEIRRLTAPEDPAEEPEEDPTP